MADKIGVELDWGLLEPTIAVAVRRTRATIVEKCGSAQDGDDSPQILWNFSGLTAINTMRKLPHRIHGRGRFCGTGLCRSSTDTAATRTGSYRSTR